MRKVLLYARLARQNVLKNKQTYLPYLFTCICCVTMFYVICYLQENTSGSTISMVLATGIFVMIIFSFLFLFYTNSFLMKRRKKEFGLYSVLGMEKRHIASVMLFETIYVYLCAILGGILFGILFSKLVHLILINLLRFPVNFEITLSVSAIQQCLVLFTLIFFVLLLYSLIQVVRSKPVELIREAQSGEREPKANWLSALCGILSLGAGYWISITTREPFRILSFFFIAVILVIVGTYLLFRAVSIVVLKLLRKNKRYYYQANHFISVSGLIYRMKQNANGLATVCILSTMVLVMISSTTALFFGMEDSIQGEYPQDITVRYSFCDQVQADEAYQLTIDTVSAHGVTPEEVYRAHLLSLTMLREGASFSLVQSNTLAGIAEINVLSAEEYARFSGESVSLQADEALLFTGGIAYGEASLSLFEKTFSVTEYPQQIAQLPYSGSEIYPVYYLVVSDLQTVYDLGMQTGRYPELSDLYLYVGINANLDMQAESDLSADISYQLRNGDFGARYQRLTRSYHINSQQVQRSEFLDLYGGLFFLGLFLGFVFMLAMVLIIYYKQISEGYDDQRQYAIMRKVGLDRRETTRAIRSQLLTMFFLPLVTACLHMLAALPAISKILTVLRLNNTLLFLQTTLVSMGVFALFYIVVYSITARAYAKLVHNP